MNSLPSPQASRRRFTGVGIGFAAGIGLSTAYPQIAAFAGELQDFIKGPPVPDIAPRQLSEHVWMIYSPDSFPTPENQGMMCNLTFIDTAQGLVVVSSVWDFGNSSAPLSRASRFTKKTAPTSKKGSLS